MPKTSLMPQTCALPDEHSTALPQEARAAPAAALTGEKMEVEALPPHVFRTLVPVVKVFRCRACGVEKTEEHFPRKWENERRVYERCRECLELFNTSFLMWRDKGVCGLCKGKVKPGEGSVDHKVPLSRGGKHCMDNVQLAHLKCNLKKGSLTQAEWEAKLLHEENERKKQEAERAKKGKAAFEELQSAWAWRLK